MSRTTKFNTVAALVALALVSTMVMRMSSAAFTGSTSNTGNSWDAGTVTLTNGAGTALFSATDIVPGYTDTKCIEVTYTGSAALSGAVEFDVAATEIADAGSNVMADDMYVTVQKPGLAAEDCTTYVAGTLVTVVPEATMAALATPATTGWTPAPNATESFIITVRFDSAVGNEAQGDGIDADFTWSATS